MIAWLVGMQSQNPPAPYLGLWTRIEGFRPDELSGLMTSRRAVRLAMMRSTVHLVTAGDCVALRPLLHEVQVRSLHQGSPFGKRLANVDLDAVVAEGRRLVEERPRTLAWLRTELGARFPHGDAEAMAMAVRNLTALVQVPPRGVWGKSGAPTCTTAEAWLGRPLAATSMDALLSRYLAAFGPASAQDAQAWSGLRGLGAILDGMDLARFEDESGRTLYDLRDAPRPDPDVPAPPRLLPEYDNVLLGHADRSRILSDEGLARMTARDGIGARAFLVDGVMAGTWRPTKQGIELDPLGTLRPADADALRAEADAWLACAAAT